MSHSNFPRNIYILDDDSAIVDSIRCYLLSVDNDLAISVFSSATQLIEYLGTSGTPVDSCLIVDQLMQGMSGTELIDHLVAEGNQIPIIMMTGHADKLLRQKAKKAGVVAFLEKPFDPEFLSEALNRV